jgi:hypothetical protein
MPNSKNKGGNRHDSHDRHDPENAKGYRLSDRHGLRHAPSVRTSSRDANGTEARLYVSRRKGLSLLHFSASNARRDGRDANITTLSEPAL